MNLDYYRNSLRLAVAVSLVCISTWAFAQNTTSCAIAGTVTDSTGAVVPGVKVTVTDQATGLTSTVTTNPSGFYSAQALLPGNYTVSTLKTGFKTQVVSNIHLDPGQRRGVDLKLDVGAASATVTVEADAVAVQTESADLGGTVSAKEVANLMLNGRNFQTLALIVPGVSAASGANSLPNYGEGGYLGQTEIVVGGTSIEKTTYSMDGLYDMDPNGMINVNVLPTLDSISEFRILKDNYSARYGMAGSGQILVETKSGGSQFHGGGYEYVRNNFIGTAKPYATPPSQGIAALHYNIFGYTLGGPLMIPRVFNPDRARKLYFFAGGEWRINHYPAALHTRNMIPQAMRNGDFSASPSLTNTSNCPGGLKPCLALTAKSAALLNTYRGLDPSTCIGPDSTGRYDQLNPKCMDPVAVAFLDPKNGLWPLPNDPGSSINYINNGTEKDSENDYNYRIDYSLNSRNQIMGRWTSEEVNNLRPARNFNDPSPNPGSTVYSRGLNAMLRWTATIRPTLINTLQGGETFNKWLLGVTNYTMPAGAKIAQQYPTADPLNRIPDITMGGGGTWAWMGVGAQPNFIHDGVGIASDDLSWMKGNHLLQAGLLNMWTIRHVNANSFPMGLIGFSGANAGDSAADLMLGLDSTYQQTSEQPQGRFHNRWWESYLEDDWKVNPRLTLNLGVRWSYWRPTWEEGDQVTNFDPGKWVASEAPAINTSGQPTPNPNASSQLLTASGTVANLTNGLVFAGQGGTPRGFNDPVKSSFGPRLGFAYRLTNDGKTSVHGGFGMGYTQIAMMETSSLLSNPPFAQSTNISNSLLSQPTAGGASGAPGIPSLTVIGSDYRPTRTNTYSVAFERQLLPSAVAQVAYAGSVSQHVLAEGYNYNFALNGATANTATCAANANNPANSSSYKGPAASKYLYDPCLNQGTVSTLYYAPYPGYGSISGTNNGGIANYNGLQTGLTMRQSSFTWNLAYTWSKALEDVQPNNPGANGTGVGYDQNGSFQNPRNQKLDYGPPDYDRRHVFTSAWVYQTPFFAHTRNVLAREALSGWGTSGLAVLESGLAVTPQLAVSGAGLATRPNRIAPVIHPGDGKTNLGHASYFSASSFQAPAWGEFGDASPGVVRGPKEVAFNVALDKSFPITERVGFKLRVEAFNVFNHPNTIVQGVWSGPASSFGDVIGAGDPRQMEFAGRITF